MYFNTKWGEELFIMGSCAALGGNETANALKLNYKGDSLWEGEINYNAVKERIISYQYFVREANGNMYYEAGKERSIAINSATALIEAHDQWTGNTAEAPFLSIPFSDVFFSRNASLYTQTHRQYNELIIRVIIPNIPTTGEILLCGSTPALGEWKIEHSISLTRLDGARWEAYLPTGKSAGEVWEYKFIRIDNLSGNYTWEEGENRKITIPKIGKHNTVIVEHASARFDPGTPRFAGCAVPVFSLRSKESHGIGDFKNIQLLVDWAKVTRQSIIQLLPVNDTTASMSWKDSYPYNCISTVALHPIYINLEELGTMKDTALLKELKHDGKILNHKIFLDYQEVWLSKMRYCKAMYEQEKENTFAEPGYYTFIKENKEWLYPYAVFSVLRDTFKTADFRQWKELPGFSGTDCSLFSEALVSKIIDKKSSYNHEAFFYVYLQYHLHKQLSRAKEYARSNGVALKGDIPIGISRNSVEAWQHPQLFNFTQQAGAPPDAFAKEGQNWGFPTYNWDKMAEDNYAWWKYRLVNLSKYFDAYRIDHILGFFRIWEIPVEYKNGLMGHFSPALPLTLQEIADWGVRFNPQKGEPSNGLFIEDPYQKERYHPMISARESSQYDSLPQIEKEAFDRLHHHYFYKRHNEFWYNNAMKKLQQLIAATNMLTCGEDLGMLADSVHDCMNNLKILSLELMIMPKQSGVELENPATYPYLSVCTTSTHDSETLRMWLGKRLGTTMGAVATIDATTTQPITDALPEDCIKILKENLAAPSMFAIFPLQDWLSIDQKIRSKYVDSERINDPSDPQHYWRYRMHITLEELIAATSFNKKVAALITKSGR